MKKILLFLFTMGIICSTPIAAFAQNASSTPTSDYVAKAVILRINSISVVDPTIVPKSYLENVEARITTGVEKDHIVTIQNSFTDYDQQKLDLGDTIYISRSLNESGISNKKTYSYENLDFDRMPVVITCILLFLISTLFFGGKQGLRGLLSLAGGVILIFFLFLPGILRGESPLFLAIIVSSLVVVIGGYITHGFSKMTTAAILGMIVTIVGTAVAAEIAIHLAHLSGIIDESTSDMTNLPEFSLVNFQELLLGGIIISLLGVLYDAAIGQAVAVEELFRIGKHLPKRLIYQRAIRIGREHIGALVNTLILAYVGISLPLILSIFEPYMESSYQAGVPLLNWEFVATDVIRTTIGATGLILTIPITTAIAVLLLVPKQSDVDPRIIEDEEASLQKISHVH